MVSITTAVEDEELRSICSIVENQRYNAESSIWRKMFVAGDWF